MGGFIVSSLEQQFLVSSWQAIKSHLCGSSNCELKWSHFFPGRHQERGQNPLLSVDLGEWREQARWAISVLFDSSRALPITVVIRKDKASESDMFMKIRGDGSKILDVDTLWLCVIGMYASYLKQHEAVGEIWLDQLGSRKEETRRQTAWEKLRDEKWPTGLHHQETLRRVSPKLRFLESHKEPLVQIADFISGVLWAAAEDDEEFLLGAFQQYFPLGPNTYTFMSNITG